MFLVAGAIRTIKRRLYTRMRVRKSNNWPAMFQWALNSVNSDYMKCLNGLRPKDVSKPELGEYLMEVTDDHSKKTHTNSVEKQATLLQKFTNDPKYKHFQPNSIVMVDFPMETPFGSKEKEVTIKRASPYVISSINFLQNKRKLMCFLLKN